MSVIDNFDYSIPTRSKINEEIEKPRPFKKLYTQRNWSLNLYNLDIESSMPRSFGIFTNKIDYINKVDDIEKSSPKILHYPLNKPEYNLTNKDIEKSSPGVNHYFFSKRNINPLQPKYNLPKVENYPPEIPKFIRNSIDIKDIKGSSPKIFPISKTRDNFPKYGNSIEGSKPKIKYFKKNLGCYKNYDYIDYSDINKGSFKSKRNINPLDPIYSFSKNKEIPFFYGFIEKSKPGTYYPYLYEPSFVNKNNDIWGTNTGSKNFINKFNGKNFEIYNFDIEKSEPGSLKKGIVTNRCTNPLMPNYQLPGEKELENMKNGEYSVKKNNNKSENLEKNCDNDKIIKIPKIKNKVIYKSNSTGDVINMKNKLEEKILEKENIKILNNDNKELKFIKKPNPFFGITHDPYIQSSDNSKHMEQIEKDKQAKKLLNRTNSFNYGNNNTKKIIANTFFINENGTNDNNSNKYPNTLEIFAEPKIKKIVKNNSCMHFGNDNEIDRNKLHFGPPQKTYVQQLDKIINNN